MELTWSEALAFALGMTNLAYIMFLYWSDKMRGWLDTDLRRLRKKYDSAVSTLATARGALNSLEFGVSCPECGGEPFTAEGETCFVCEGLGRVPQGMCYETYQR